MEKTELKVISLFLTEVIILSIGNIFQAHHSKLSQVYDKYQK